MYLYQYKKLKTMLDEKNVKSENYSSKIVVLHNYTFAPFLISAFLL
jgi:hypothetical protein